MARRAAVAVTLGTEFRESSSFCDELASGVDDK
jgi:hypothetical protein